MSDVAIVAAVALVAAAVVAVVWLRLHAATIQRADERAERERGLAPQFEALKTEVANMRTEQRTFIANNRRG